MAMRFPENYLTTLHTRAPAQVIAAELVALTDIVGAATAETAAQRKLLAIESHLGGGDVPGGCRAREHDVAALQLQRRGRRSTQTLLAVATLSIPAREPKGRRINAAEAMTSKQKRRAIGLYDYEASDARQRHAARFTEPHPA